MLKHLAAGTAHYWARTARRSECNQLMPSSGGYSQRRNCFGFRRGNLAISMQRTTLVLSSKPAQLHMQVCTQAKGTRGPCSTNALGCKIPRHSVSRAKPPCCLQYGMATVLTHAASYHFGDSPGAALLRKLLSYTLFWRCQTRATLTQHSAM